MQRMFWTIKRPTETQCASLVSKPSLYQKRWDITSETIRVRQEAYKASPLADLTSFLASQSIKTPFTTSIPKMKANNAHTPAMSTFHTSPCTLSWLPTKPRYKRQRLIRL